ncbi:hypothetical protein NA57DRAFT_70007 [Rhizodiscina lignyota]|uniref:Calcium uniporter protein n=1 Tax=Rhizodiscina lignyota TaxID=1504668 RepID=A0A9P4MAC4_9PEZI|nr:hypothetical protein NA57DRAFT_70007 [Rhizodiscina lignyota]
MRSQILLGISRVSTSKPATGHIFRTIITSSKPHASDSSYAAPAEKLNHDVSEEEKLDYDRRIAEEGKERQIRTPWHRAGSEAPPVARERSAGAMTRGKLLTTPSRMLKLILPLTTRDHNQDRKNVEPLALLVHPQQPLSYLERLIQSELPMIQDGDKERIPHVYFRAEDSTQDSLEPKRTTAEEDENDEQNEDSDLREDADAEVIEGKHVRTGKLNSQSEEAAVMRGGPGEGGVESYSGLGHEADDSDDSGERKFVRWSSSTEIGDFIRDAARGQEFGVEIEGAPTDIRVGVPSFNDRTYYLRMRLRKKSEQISQMADLKRECDLLARKGAQRVAMGGFVGLCGWWYLVYRLTFETDLGWDVMEPVTYLVGLSTLIGGYVWFLYHNREVSYRSAMNFTISRRQSKLYDQKGFDLARWEALVEEGNALRREIKAVAQEYDVEWDESKDEVDDKVKRALKKERRRKGEQKEKKKDDDDDEDDD